MSLLDHPDDIQTPNIQVWDNAAFDNGESEVRTLSWSTMQDSYKNPSSQSLQSDCSKENLYPLSLKTPASVKYSVSVKPLNRNGVIENSQGKPFKTPKMYDVKGKEEEEVISKEKNIDVEIEETEREINRLATRLKALQLQKAERNIAGATVQKSGRFVPIRSVDPKVTSKNSDGVNKMFEDGLVEPKICHNRGLSLGPSEIHGGIGARRQENTKLTPVRRMQNRRQSCLPKLLDINEEKAKNRRGNSISLSPKSRTLMKAQTVRQLATTIVSKRPVKKDGIVELIQPKKLFKDIEKSAPPTSVKKPLSTGRIVASRYNLTNESSQVATENRKRSLPGNCKDDESSRYDKRQSSLELCRSKAPQSRVKKRWEIPSEIKVLQQEREEGCLESSVSKMGDMLPRIITTRCVNMSPRDSGPAKRVAELIESRTNFFADEEMEASICQKLNFVEDEEEE